MEHGFFIEDITNFDELVEYLEEHITRTLNRLNRRKSLRLLRKKLHHIISENLVDEIGKYGWTGEEEFDQKDSANMFLKVFKLYDPDLFFKWKEIFSVEIEEGYTLEPSDEERLLQEFELHIQRVKGNPIIPIREIASFKSEVWCEVYRLIRFLQPRRANGIE